MDAYSRDLRGCDAENGGRGRSLDDEVMLLTMRVLPSERSALMTLTCSSSELAVGSATLPDGLTYYCKAIICLVHVAWDLHQY
jgi:hypothetical protein